MTRTGRSGSLKGNVLDRGFSNRGRPKTGPLQGPLPDGLPPGSSVRGAVRGLGPASATRSRRAVDDPQSRRWGAQRRIRALPAAVALWLAALPAAQACTACRDEALMRVFGPAFAGTLSALLLPLALLLLGVLLAALAARRRAGRRGTGPAA